MCGIAGIADLADRRPVPGGILQAMAQALFHRGPDEDGFLERPGLGLASRRLSIVGLADGRQPIANEDGSVAVVYNGELFDYPEMRAALEARGHHFATHCDTELIPHLWEEHGEALFEKLRGQFALALWDQRQQRLILARDRFGICPLFWTRQPRPSGDWLLFASEIKALLASGMVAARPDAYGINQVFSFFALPGPVTCFQGVQSLLPGHYLSVQFGAAGKPARLSEHTYWEIDFPDRGQEDRGPDPRRLVDEFEAVLLRAVERRLRADVPVVSYLSGGVDSSMVVALARHVRGTPPPTFTIRIEDPALDETRESGLVARRLGAEPVVVGCGAAEILDTYPRLIEAAEGPVIDTACAALLLLAQEVHARGYKVALTGEGADEWLAGYPWYKIHRLLGYLDVIPGLGLSQLARRAYLRLTGSPRFPWSVARRAQAAVGGSNAWLDIYGLMSISKMRFYSRQMQEALSDHVAYTDLGLNLKRARRWHPLNRGLYVGARVMLPGLLLSAKGDRVAMHSSVETRYPFLDEDVFAFCARLDPTWKLHGFRDKHILRRLAERWLPSRIVRRRKTMFRAPFDSFYAEPAPAFVDQLLSDESLRKTGYFDLEAVRHWRRAFRGLRAGSNQRLSVEMGLVGVMSTQLWHHTFIDSSLAELPSRLPAQPSLVAS
ncbi:MAG TPA: asparagine synthase (glutamine-hydrolyzing) [Gemmataceae bacterium]|jgi:asparagine synthase (glutamine-hydrolysing)|nr:asparagine synthase (glutamine-hydrolyzing) [Gemmataceae bacterium]